jgi:hypothetical protein
MNILTTQESRKELISTAGSLNVGVYPLLRLLLRSALVAPRRHIAS